MATVKVYRLAYCFDRNGGVANIKFSNWVRVDDLDAVENYINSVQPEGDGSPAGVDPTILGWEEKELDTDPS